MSVWSVGEARVRKVNSARVSVIPKNLIIYKIFEFIGHGVFSFLVFLNERWKNVKFRVDIFLTRISYIKSIGVIDRRSNVFFQN